LETQTQTVHPSAIPKLLAGLLTLASPPSMQPLLSIALLPAAVLAARVTNLAEESVELSPQQN
jgi:hypothetical protein